MATSIFCIVHHRLERALRHVAALGHRLGQHARRDLPRQAPFVLAPAARALRAAVADDRVPVTVGLRLVVGGDLEGERLAVLERVPAVEADARHAAHRELDRQDVARLAAGKVGRRPVHRADRAVGKGPGVEARGLFRVMVVPQADRVLVHRALLLAKPLLRGLSNAFLSNPSFVRRLSSTAEAR